MRLPGRHASLAFCVGVLLAWPIGASALTGPEGIARVNAWRAESGIPADIVESPSRSAGCALHNAYMLKYGVLQHEENPTLPGYTAEGDDAGRSAILTSGTVSSGQDPSTVFWNGQRPFELAPIHLVALMNPRLESLGYAETTAPRGLGQDARLCITTSLGRTRQATPFDATWSVPGDRAVNVRASEVARESPFVPGDFVGLPQGTTTGPHLYVYAQGPALDDVRVTAAKLSGPDGDRELRWVDRSTPTVGEYLPLGGAILIPVRPLEEVTTYRATATLADPNGSTVTRTWSFTTGGAPPPPPKLVVKDSPPISGALPPKIPKVAVQGVARGRLQVKVIQRWTQRSRRRVLFAVNAPGGLRSFGGPGAVVTSIRNPAANHPYRFRVTVVLTRRRATLVVEAVAGGRRLLRLW